MGLPLLVASARPAHYCMTLEHLLRSFTCESKQADPFNSPFSKVKLREPPENIYRGAMAETRNIHWGEKMTKQAKKHNYVLLLPMQLLVSHLPSLHLGLHTWFLLPIRFGAGDFEGDLTFWVLPPFSAICPTFITADIMASMEDKSAPSKLFGELGDTL